MAVRYLIKKKRLRNALRFDPTRTGEMRRRAERKVRAQFRNIRAALVDAVASRDVLRLTVNASFSIGKAITTPPFDFGELATMGLLDDSEKVKLFVSWLRDLLGDQLADEAEMAAWQTFAEEGWKKGAGRAFDDARRDPARWGKAEGEFYKGSKAEFLRSSFGQPESAEKVKLLAERTFAEMEGLTEDAVLRLSRTLVDGLVRGAGPEEIASDLVKALDFSEARAQTVARTELIRAHAEGQLDALEDMGVTQVGVMVEWNTAGDNKVCKLCRPLEGAVLNVSESHGLLPRHPNCRCAWVPYVQIALGGKRNAKATMTAILKSRALGGKSWGGNEGWAADFALQTNALRTSSRKDRAVSRLLVNSSWAEIKLLANAGFDESKVKRDEEGQFADKGSARVTTAKQFAEREKDQFKPRLGHHHVDYNNGVERTDDEKAAVKTWGFTKSAKEINDHVQHGTTFKTVEAEAAVKGLTSLLRKSKLPGDTVAYRTMMLDAEPKEGDEIKHAGFSAFTLQEDFAKQHLKNLGAKLHKNEYVTDDGEAFWKSMPTGNAEFKEDLHPRGADGKFVEAGRASPPDAAGKFKTLKASMGGSNGAKLVQDSKGDRYVVKKQKKEHQGRMLNEYTADSIYRAMGVLTPDSGLVGRIQKDGTGQVLKWGAYLGEGLTTLGQYQNLADKKQVEKIHREIGKHFVLDALLSSWDVVGMDGDNILVDKDHRPWRVDNGGSLKYRAQGAPKGAAFDGDVTELKTLRDKKVNPRTAEVYAHLTDEEVRDQIKQVVAKQADILAKVKDPETKAILEKRLNYLHKQLGNPLPVGDVSEKAQKFPTGVSVSAYLKGLALNKISDFQYKKIEEFNPGGIADGSLKVPTVVAKNKTHLDFLVKHLPAGVVVKGVTKAQLTAEAKGVKTPPPAADEDVSSLKDKLSDPTSLGEIKEWFKLNSKPILTSEEYDKKKQLEYMHWPDIQEMSDKQKKEFMVEAVKKPTKEEKAAAKAKEKADLKKAKDLQWLAEFDKKLWFKKTAKQKEKAGALKVLYKTELDAKKAAEVEELKKKQLEAEKKWAETAPKSGGSSDWDKDYKKKVELEEIKQWFKLNDKPHSQKTDEEYKKQIELETKHWPTIKQLTPAQKTELLKDSGLPVALPKMSYDEKKKYEAQTKYGPEHPPESFPKAPKIDSKGVEDYADAGEKKARLKLSSFPYPSAGVKLAHSKMDPPEKNAISKWAGSSLGIRKAFYDPGHGAVKTAENLVKALTKLPPYDGVVYHGMKIKDMENPKSSFGFKQLQRIITAGVGGTWSDKAPMPTTTSSSVAADFASSYIPGSGAIGSTAAVFTGEGDLSKTQVALTSGLGLMFKIKSKTARPIKGAGGLHGEDELLTMPGTVYRIKRIVRNVRVSSSSFEENKHCNIYVELEEE